MGQHNIHFYHQLMREIRQSILEDRFLPLYHQRRQILQVHDIDHPVTGEQQRPAKETISKAGDYELYQADHGPMQIRHAVTHDRVLTETEPKAETHPLAAKCALLARRLRLPDGANPQEATPLIVWDTCMGAAASALAAILVYEAEAEKGPVRPMQLVSFTEDLSALKLALTHKKHFAYLRHGAADTLLRRGEWNSRYKAGLSWKLMLGDATVKQAAAAGPAEILLNEATAN